MANLSSLTDEQLALAYASGDNRAFDELLERNQSKLFTYIYFTTGDYEVANDIFQDTFLKVIKKLQEGKYQASGKFRHWITSIAHNAIIDWFRSSNRIMVTNIEDAENNGGSDWQPDLNDGEETILSEQMKKELRRMVVKLPHSQREVVYLRYYCGMPFKEIAEVTNVSINTSLGRMRYAVLNLRKMMCRGNVPHLRQLEQKA